jgi:hypothetical protein
MISFLSLGEAHIRTLEEHNTASKHSFHRKVFINIPKAWLKRCDGQQIRCTVPGDIVKRMEFCCYDWSGNADDVHVKSVENSTKSPDLDQLETIHVDLFCRKPFPVDNLRKDDRGRHERKDLEDDSWKSAHTTAITQSYLTHVGETILDDSNTMQGPIPAAISRGVRIAYWGVGCR